MSDMVMGRADPEKVREIFGEILPRWKAVLESLSQGERNASIMDILMASHNLHKWIIIHLEGITEDKNNILRRTATDTLSSSLLAAGGLEAGDETSVSGALHKLANTLGTLFDWETDPQEITRIGMSHAHDEDGKAWFHLAQALIELINNRNPNADS